MPRTFENAKVGVTDPQRTKAAELLDRVLADQFLLYTKSRNFHWNVVGSQFAVLHSFFEDHYEQLDGMMDETAEFARFYGIKSIGTMTEFLAASKLSEQPGEYPDSNGMIRILLEDHEAVIRNLREQIEVAGNELKLADLADYFTQIIEKHEKMAWMLRAQLG